MTTMPSAKWFSLLLGDTATAAAAGCAAVAAKALLILLLMMMTARRKRINFCSLKVYIIFNGFDTLLAKVPLYQMVLMYTTRKIYNTFLQLFETMQRVFFLVFLRFRQAERLRKVILSDKKNGQKQLDILFHFYAICCGWKSISNLRK